MFNQIAITNFRGFKNFTVEGLSRVNLLVGKNNSGKTSILEAVDLLASRGHYDSLIRASIRRGTAVHDSNSAAQPLMHGEFAYVQDFFFGHELDAGSAFEVMGDLDSKVKARVEDPSRMDARLRERFGNNARVASRQPAHALILEGDGFEPDAFPISADGVFQFRVFPQERHLDNLATDALSEPLCVGPGEVTVTMMRSWWNRLVLESREESILDYLHLIEPKVTDIQFLVSDEARQPRNARGVVLGLSDRKRRQPLSSFGDGMRRLLALGLALNNAKAGVIGLDEIDTGLHYTTLPDMWRLVIETARKQDVQVFATTHSKDCLEGLARACEERPDLAEEVSIQKIHAKLDHSVCFAGAEFANAYEMDVEVR